MALSVVDQLSESAYEGYAYSYPHKTAYRHFDQPLPLTEVWQAEKREALFLYIHIPFCEMRCGFCNLFTQVGARQSLVARYLDKLAEHAEIARRALPNAQFVRLAIGGGTPTYLDNDGLEQTFDIAEKMMGANVRRIPVSVEVSPATLTNEKVALLAERGTSRISIGVQSFVEEETRAVGRAQRTAVVEQALQMIRRARFEALNIDLIYGLPGQTISTWELSIRRALEYAPEELYLYPLYIRPLTGLGRTEREWDDTRRTLYRAGRELLLREGYEQLSMRMFRRRDANQSPAPPYRCQEDAMVGLGCGARSYTQALHYCSEYAVGAADVRQIIAGYLENDEATFDRVAYGFHLDGDEQRRRYVIQSLLSEEGLRLSEYQARFAAEAIDDLPLLDQLREQELVAVIGDEMKLTEAGLELSDQIGPAFYSDRVRRLMREFKLR